MFGRLKAAWRRRRLRRALRRGHPDDALWRRLRRELPLLRPLDRREAVRLREHTALFLAEKRFTGVRGLEVTPWMEGVVAAQACLLVLEPGPEPYAGWREVVLYPDRFRVRRLQQDETGVVHRVEAPLSGEAWEQGPVILDWRTVEAESLQLHPGRHLVIHEFAHKLDAGNGRTNGMPPLHPEMPREAWTRALSRAWERLQAQLEHGGRPCIDPYAATSPAEFFAVVSEYFFTAPDHLRRVCPEVYGQLVRYYRQDPLRRLQRPR